MLTPLLCLSLLTLAPADRPEVLIVVGAPGTPEYGEMFEEWADRWEAAAAKGLADSRRLGDEEDDTTPRDQLQEYLAEQASAANEHPLWIVLIGHGTYDGREARFNLAGPDMTAVEFAEWVKPLQRPVVVINCASASAPFLNQVSGENRVIVTATRSGHELNFARFGQYLSEAISDPAADLDKDEQVSLLEAYLTASSRTAEFYRVESRLATEHSLLDDNGDQKGTPAEWFRGVRAVERAADGAQPDGTRAHQLHLIPSERERSIPAEVRQRRDELELTLAELREQKATLPEDEYYDRVEAIMLELARMYQQLEAGQ